jgi:hypothetical protein
MENKECVRKWFVFDKLERRTPTKIPTREAIPAKNITANFFGIPLNPFANRSFSTNGMAAAAENGHPTMVLKATSPTIVAVFFVEGDLKDSANAKVIRYIENVDGRKANEASFIVRVELERLRV